MTEDEKRERKRKYRANRRTNSPEKVAAENARYKKKHREQVAAQRAMYRVEHKAQIAAYDVAYHATHKEVMIAFKESNVQQQAARRRVAAEVRAGRFPSAKTMVCDICQEAMAAHWHHHNGYGPGHEIDVIAVCRKCHGKAHSHVWGEA